MKKRIPLIMTLAIAFASCTSEELDTINNNGDAQNTEWLMHSRYNMDASNASNPFDIAGKAYAAVANRYLDADFGLQTNAQILQSLNTTISLTPEFQLLNGSGTAMLTNANLNWYNSGEDHFLTAVNQSALSATGKLKAIEFVDALGAMEADGKTASEIHSSIVAWEANLTTISGLSTSDLQSLFNLSSVMRYSNSMERRRKDKEWLAIRTKATAVIYGENENRASSVLLAVAIEFLFK